MGAGFLLLTDSYFNNPESVTEKYLKVFEPRVFK